MKQEQQNEKKKKQLTVAGQFDYLIKEGGPRNLCRMFAGWALWL
jgi:hypothetical protein